MKSRWPLLLFLVGCGLLLIWFIRHIETVGGRPLTLVREVDPHSYDPQQTSAPTTFEVFRHACEPLFYEFEGTVWGLLAEDEVEFLHVGLVVIVRILPDIFFHDGTELTAEIVQASFERLQRLGKSSLLTNLEGVTVQADGKFVIFSLPQPDYEFVRLTLTSPYAAVVLPRSETDIFPICTGPYYFAPELYRPDKSLTLVRHNRYRWAPRYFRNLGMAKIPRLEILFEVDSARRVDLLQTGRACVASLEREDAVEHKHIYEAIGGVIYLGFNQLHTAWQDEAVRQALAMAIDKERLAQSGPYLPAQAPLTPVTLGYSPQIAQWNHTYDQRQSQALLKELNFDFAAQYTLLIAEDSNYRELAQLILNDLTAVGLTNVQIRGVSRAAVLSERQNFDLLLFDYFWRDYTTLANFLGPTSHNLLNYPDDNIRELVRAARGTADPELRQALILQAQRLVLDKAIWEPLLFRKIIVGVESRCVTGQRQLKNGLLVFQDAETR